MDVSHVNLVYQTSRPVPSVGVDLPKPEKILMRDKFQVVNLGSHFASQENGLSALFSEEWCARPETKQCKRIAEEIVYKRLHTTGVVWLAASMLRGTPGHGPRTVAQVEYKFQFKNKNMPGIYEAHWRLYNPDNKVIQARVLSAEEEAAWLPDVEVLDVEARVRDCVLM
ncbi:hypothetical protein H2198_005337 [Neophaeococcomyces mojaviensis]|uniref:Uncharacterized protein n=1 Tax=Neophaeococcomyces mojaviensis TaxID=3383035 RepID=A0ACC3A612_9EURO|nr:hypothetical protein H2198_005337 [Knufia sp. JES_112]